MATTDAADTEPPDDLDAAIGAIYGGPLDEFVTARDRLARELRAAGRRDEAAAVGKLTKPKRLAWALDAAVLADRAEFEGVDTAAEALADAGSGTDVREATNALRGAARSLADAAAERAATSGGAALNQSELVPAVLAVAADPEALAALRAGRLVDVPSAGAFGAFAPGPRRPAGARPSSRAKRDAEADSDSSASPESPPRDQARPPAAGRAPVTAREAKAAERAAAHAESLYEAARRRVEDAAAAADRAAAELAAAEDRRRGA
ncbi:MAG: hypothetical protein ACRD07_15895, partial [Acidimicrobiales bacterium]